VVEIPLCWPYFEDVKTGPQEVPMSTENEKIVILTPAPRSVYSYSWSRMKRHFLDLFLITIIVAAVLIPVGMIQSLDGHETPGGVLLRIFSFGYWFLLFSPIDFGAAWVFLKAMRNGELDVKDTFSTFDNYLNVVLANLLVSAIIGIGLGLLVVPGVILACRLAFVRYLVMDKKMEPVEAVQESWRMTRGHSNSIFFSGLLALAILIAGLLCFGVGVIPAYMWVRSAFASMYFAVSELEKSRIPASEGVTVQAV
jgi:uncharacterized membrane protein